MNDFPNDAGLSNRELVFHSFCLTGKRAIRGKAPAEIIDPSFGHANGSVSMLHGRGAGMQILRNAVEKISCPDVDGPRVIRRVNRSARSAPTDVRFGWTLPHCWTS